MNNTSDAVYWISLCMAFFALIFFTFIFFYIRSIAKRGIGGSDLEQYELTEKNHGGNHRG